MDRRTLLIASGALAALPSSAVRAQAFPSRPITLVLRISRRWANGPGATRIRRISIAHVGAADRR